MSLKCLKCDAPGPPGTCACWILLCCPSCGNKRWVDRDTSECGDPAEAVKVHIRCPDCDAGDFDGPIYFDRAGREIHWEPTS